MPGGSVPSLGCPVFGWLFKPSWPLCTGSKGLDFSVSPPSAHKRVKGSGVGPSAGCRFVCTLMLGGRGSLVRERNYRWPDIRWGMRHEGGCDGDRRWSVVFGVWWLLDWITGDVARNSVLLWQEELKILEELMESAGDERYRSGWKCIGEACCTRDDDYDHDEV